MAGNKFVMSVRDHAQHNRARLLAARLQVKLNRRVTLAELYERAMQAYLKTGGRDVR